MFAATEGLFNGYHRCGRTRVVDIWGQIRVSIVKAAREPIYVGMALRKQVRATPSSVATTLCGSGPTSSQNSSMLCALHARYVRLAWINRHKQRSCVRHWYVRYVVGSRCSTFSTALGRESEVAKPTTAREIIDIIRDNDDADKPA